MSTSVAYAYDEQMRPDELAQRRQRLGDDALMPVIEGARARGVADAFEMIGQGAILLDATGSVLHASSKALQLMGAELSIASGHLVAQTASSNHAVQRLIARILDAEESPESVALARSDGLPSVRIRGYSFGNGTANPYQLLAAVLLIDESIS